MQCQTYSQHTEDVVTDFQIIIVDLLIHKGLFYFSDVLIVMMVEHVLDFL